MSKGFGFIQFAKDSVNKRMVKELKKIEINGKLVDLKIAEKRFHDRGHSINKRAQEEE